MPKKPIQLVALDLDGTLLSPDKTISLANKAAIERALSLGVKVVLASGRMHQATVRYAIQLDLVPETFVISYNGGMARTVAGKTYFHHPLNADAARFLVDFCYEHDLHLNFYLNDLLYTQKLDYWSEWYERRTGCASIAADLRDFSGREPTKLIIVDMKETLKPLLPVMRSTFEDKITVMKTDDEYLEFMDPVASKGDALAKIAAELKIERESCLTMGDNFNDVSMLKWAGFGYVMADGRPEVVAQFPNHAPPSTEDGVATIMNRLIEA